MVPPSVEKCFLKSKVTYQSLRLGISGVVLLSDSLSREDILLLLPPPNDFEDNVRWGRTPGAKPYFMYCYWAAWSSLIVLSGDGSTSDALSQSWCI